MEVIRVCAAGSFDSGAEVIKLKAVNYLPAAHKMFLLTAKFCDERKLAHK
jgi:hypothetical protein